MIDRFFEKIADGLGTNWAIIVFALIAFVPLYFQLPKTIIEWQMWLSQTCIQLVALAVLQKGTRIEGGRSAKLLQEAHDAVMAEFDDIKDIHKDLNDEIQLLKEVVSNHGK